MGKVPVGWGRYKGDWFAQWGESRLDVVIRQSQFYKKKKGIKGGKMNLGGEPRVRPEKQNSQTWTKEFLGGCSYG